MTPVINENYVIAEVQPSDMIIAAQIHSKSWCESHADFCSKEFIALHNTAHQLEYLENEVRQGKRLYMLTAGKPVGIVTIWGDMIENLYILPSEQRRGYGTELLTFAIKQCTGPPHLWILDNNKRAYNLYTKYGFGNDR